MDNTDNKKAEELRFARKSDAWDIFDQSFYRERGFAPTVLNFPSPLSMVIQPLNPGKKFVDLSELFEKFDSIVEGRLPHLRTERIELGAMQYDYQEGRAERVLQMYVDGLFFALINLCEDKEGKRILEVNALTIYLIKFLKIATNFYHYLGYGDGLSIEIKLNNLKDTYLDEGLLSSIEMKRPSKFDLSWKFEPNAKQLSDLDEFLYKFFQEIYWSLGLEPLSKSELAEYWEKN